MDNPSPSRLHPLMGAAAISVILFSGVGIAALTGLLPLRHEAAPATAATTSAPEALAAAPAVAAPAPVPAPAPTVVVEKVVEKTEAPRVVHKRPAVRQESTQSVASAPACYNCGTVVAVDVVAEQGQASGVGAVGGAVLGGVVGHQFGNGHGKQAMTALGAIGGALAGNQVEKNQRQTMRYDVTVRMADGSSRTMSYTSPPAFSSGDRVRVEGNTLMPAY